MGTVSTPPIAGSGKPPPGEPRPGREAQRRRTRAAILDAATALVAAGRTPSIGEIAGAADVSRRTVYTYFPTLDQLLLDATVGAMRLDVEAALDAVGTDDPRARVVALVRAITERIDETLPLGRALIRLTVDAPAGEEQPRRGYRRVRWIEQALEPLRGRLAPDAFEDLVSALAVVVGWEAFVVLLDVRGCTPEQAGAVLTSTALAVLDGVLRST